jgi:Holliday junction resolvasome RuvABC ATP-dependent DNA helicase subunit
MQRSLIEFYGGARWDLETLAATINEKADTLEDCLRAYLLQQGFLTRSPGADASPGKPTTSGHRILGQQSMDE